MHLQIQCGGRVILPPRGTPQGNGLGRIVGGQVKRGGSAGPLAGLGIEVGQLAALGGIVHQGLALVQVVNHGEVGRLAGGAIAQQPANTQVQGRALCWRGQQVGCFLDPIVHKGQLYPQALAFMGFQHRHPSVVRVLGHQ